MERFYDTLKMAGHVTMAESALDLGEELWEASARMTGLAPDPGLGPPSHQAGRQ